MNYELYPISSSYINYPIYYMVRYFFSIKHFLCLPSCEFDKEWRKVEIGNGIGLSLTFPSDDYSVSYDGFTLQKEVIILNDCTNTHNEHYYIDINPDTNNYCVVNERDTFARHGRPQFFNNTVQFRRELEKMYSLLKEMEQGGNCWTQRLKTVIKMLDEKVNELHILHNAGLYDFHILERNLVNQSLDESKWRLAFNDYVSQLKVFAMYSLNNLGWSMHSSGAGDDLENPEAIHMIEREYKRRRKMMTIKDNDIWENSD